MFSCISSGDGLCVFCGMPCAPRCPVFPSQVATTEQPPPVEQVTAGGPGAELKILLAGWPLYITATPDCSCNARAAEMDRQGVDWCEANIDTIVGWLREQAAGRGLPFLDLAGRLLVRRAIRNARKAAAAAQS